MDRFAWGILLLVAMAPELHARADALLPIPPADCPEGASSIATHGHGGFAYCSPSLAPAEGDCVEGRRVAIVGLEIGTRHVPPRWDARRGPMPPEMAAMGTDLSVVLGACEPPADAPSWISAPPPFIPPGCQRFRVWIEDASVRCQPASPATPAPAPTPTAAAPASSGCSAHSGARSWALSAMAIAIVVARRRRQA